jgi:hypothetical protein
VLRAGRSTLRPRDCGVVVEPSSRRRSRRSSRRPVRRAAAARLERRCGSLDHLDGTSIIRFAHRVGSTIRTRSRSVQHRPGIDVPLSGAGAGDRAAGVYIVSVSLIRPGDTDPRESNVAADVARARAASADDRDENATTRRHRHARREAAASDPQDALLSSGRLGRRRTRRRRRRHVPARRRRRSQWVRRPSTASRACSSTVPRCRRRSMRLSL